MDLVRLLSFIYVVLVVEVRIPAAQDREPTQEASFRLLRNSMRYENCVTL